MKILDMKSDLVKYAVDLGYYILVSNILEILYIKVFLLWDPEDHGSSLLGLLWDHMHPESFTHNPAVESGGYWILKFDCAVGSCASWIQIFITAHVWSLINDVDRYLR